MSNLEKIWNGREDQPSIDFFHEQGRYEHWEHRAELSRVTGNTRRFIRCTSGDMQLARTNACREVRQELKLNLAKVESFTYCRPMATGRAEFSTSLSVSHSDLTCITARRFSRPCMRRKPNTKTSTLQRAAFNVTQRAAPHQRVLPPKILRLDSSHSLIHTRLFCEQTLGRSK